MPSDTAAPASRALPILKKALPVHPAGQAALQGQRNDAHPRLNAQSFRVISRQPKATEPKHQISFQ